MIDNYENYRSSRSGFSRAFQKIFSKYLKDERKKRRKLEFIKNPSQIFLDVIYNKKNGNEDEEDNINNLFSEEEMDFDMHKFVINNKNKINENYKSSNKSLFKYLFINENNENNNKKEDDKKNILKLKLKKDKKIYKSLSQQLSPSIITFNNKNALKFPKIMNQKAKVITRNPKYNNLLINTNIESNMIPNNSIKNKFLKNSLSVNGKGIHINKKKRLKLLYNTGFNTKIAFRTINNYNKNKYFKRLNSLTNKSKEILKKITFYSSNENIYINEQIKKYNLLNEKYTKKNNDYMTDNIIKFN